MIRVIQVQGGCAERLISQEEMDKPAEQCRSANFNLFAFAHKTLFFIAFTSKADIFKLSHLQKSPFLLLFYGTGCGGNRFLAGLFVIARQRECACLATNQPAFFDVKSLFL